jgi:hypothetical protein
MELSASLDWMETISIPQMPENNAPTRKTEKLIAVLNSTRNASPVATAMKQPVYFALATDPASRPTSSARWPFLRHVFLV